MRPCRIWLSSISSDQQIEFRAQAARTGLRHFLEVFDPNVPGLAPADPGAFLNDFIARTLAAVPRASRPLFLKMPYHGARAMADLRTTIFRFFQRLRLRYYDRTPVGRLVTRATEVRRAGAR